MVPHDNGLPSQINSFKDKNLALGFIDEIWARLTTLSACESPTQQSEMRDWSKYITRGSYIGSGASGEVYEGKWDNVSCLGVLTPPDVVLKILRPSLRNELEQSKKVRRELEVWMKLRHTNIVPFIGVAYDLVEGNDKTACPRMISLRMANGDLKDYLSQNWQTCAKETFPLQIAQGLAYLHRFNPEIVHGDLKAKNVFVDNDATLKLGDFGLSRMMSDETLWISSAKTAHGTIRWMSPELHEPQSTVTKASDIYAFAMTLFEIFSNEMPFERYKSDGQVILAVAIKNERSRRPCAIKNWIWDIMNDCWSLKPSQRLNIEEVIERLESGVLNDVETKGNINILSSPIESALENLEELWARLTPLSPHESATQCSEIRDWSKYIIRGTYIGSGISGEVYAGTWANVLGPKDPAPPEVVMKIMRPSLWNGLSKDKRVRRELLLWMKLRHPNIVPFIGVSYDPTEGDDGNTYPSLISLRMANGDLKDYLSQNWQTCAKETFPIQIARGLAYLHHFDPEIVHGDLKTENVIVDGDGTLKLGSFGLSRVLSDESLWVSSTDAASGAVRWMSPELFQERAEFTKESDIYAFAMTLIEIFSNCVPFEQYPMDTQVIVAVVIRKEIPKRPHAIGDRIWDIMKDCWCFEPSQRLRIEEIIERLENNHNDIPS